MLDTRLVDEPARLAALHRYAILDTPRAEPFDKITSLVRDVLGVPICAVSLVDRERQWFKSIQGLDVTETPRSMSFCSHTIQDPGLLVVSNALDDARFANNPLVTGAPHIRSYAGAPLRTPDGYNVGALCAIDTVARDFGEAQLGILSSFAVLVVDELELRRVAETDHLTGALSRRGFLDHAQKEIERFRRGNRGAVLALLDIDHFKSVNDRYGHPTGDLVLKAVTKACMAHLRASDFFGRLGGEEFGILLCETDEEGGKLAAEKIRAMIADQLVPVFGGIRVTASFGLSPIDDTIATAGQWVADADRALYEAKGAGRNCGVVADKN
jgi:diguanylate cyclase (GGDEF)-like protein